MCRAPSGVKVKWFPVVIVTLVEPCFFQAIKALGVECFTLQNNLEVSPWIAFKTEGVTDTLEEIPVGWKFTVTVIVFAN